LWRGMGGGGGDTPAMEVSFLLLLLPKVRAQQYCARITHEKQANLACLCIFLPLARKGMYLFVQEGNRGDNWGREQLSCSLFAQAARDHLLRYVSPIFNARGFFSLFFFLVFLFFSSVLLNKKFRSSLPFFILCEEFIERGSGVKFLFFE